MIQDKTIKPTAWAKPTFDYNTFTYSFDFRNKNNYVLPPMEAAIETVKYITENYPAPYVLYLSGGADSQAMLYAWYMAKVEFQTYSAVFNNNLNNFDLAFLKNFASNLDISINFVDFDLFTFLEDEHDFYARNYYTGSPQYTSFMKMVNGQKEGTAIMAGNLYKPHSYYYDNITKQKIKVLHYAPSFCQNSIGLYHYANKTGKSFIPFFFIETEYLAHSFTVVPNENIKEAFQKLLEATATGNTNLIDIAQYHYKIAYYQNNGFPVIPQDDKFKGKYNGFELVKEHYDRVYEHLMQSLTGQSLIDFQKEYKRLRIAHTSRQKSKRYFDIKYRNIYETFVQNHKLVIKQV